jgi:hypothetical protein
MRLHDLKLKNLNARSENPIACFDESWRTITKVFTHKRNQLLAKKKKNPDRISNRTTKKKRCAQGFSAFDTE